jgi:predicted DCC family thiol-disulfide oxidoreductase YuxK
MNTVQTILFYDGGCPLCRREINHYQRLDRTGRVEWVDISRDTPLLQAFGIPLATAMARLHALTRDGRLVTGAYAFAAVWSELPYYRWLAKGLWALRLLGLLDRAYQRFADWRFRRRCRDGVCGAVAAD